MYICPVCKKRLKKLDNVLHCQNGHSFDIARKGYVNLLTTNKRNPKNSGDNAEMVKARTSFLDKGYYLPLAERIAQTAQRELGTANQPMIIDSGCGEGFYTCVYARQLPEARLFGIDISKAGGVVPDSIVYNSDESATGTTEGTTGGQDGSASISADDQLMAALRYLS